MESGTLLVFSKCMPNTRKKHCPFREGCPQMVGEPGKGKKEREAYLVLHTGEFVVKCLVLCRAKESCGWSFVSAPPGSGICSAGGVGGYGICRETAYYGVLGEGEIDSSEPHNAGHFTFPETSLRMGML